MYARSGVFFFFQAEDGIRYLVRSRGLGDLYKRQVLLRVTPEDRDQVATAFRELLAATPDKFSIDYRVLGGTGETRWVSSRGRVVERLSLIHISEPTRPY